MKLSQRAFQVIGKIYWLDEALRLIIQGEYMTYEKHRHILLTYREGIGVLRYDSDRKALMVMDDILRTDSRVKFRRIDQYSHALRIAQIVSYPIEGYNENVPFDTQGKGDYTYAQ